MNLPCRDSRVLVAALCVLAMLAPISQAGTRFIDLYKTPPDIDAVGAYKVSGGGDVNGDGRGDFLAARGDFSTQPTEGRVYVVFGDPSASSIDLNNLGDAGFVIRGSKLDDGASNAAIVGDVNGDGLDDVLVGAPHADNNGRLDSGSAYVVFGKASTTPVLLMQFDGNAQATAGYRIDGPGTSALAGRAVAAAGDVNGDGLMDVLVAAPFAGATYVVFGQSSLLPIDLRTFNSESQGDRGYKIDTPSPYADIYYSVAGAGDVNGDGTPDAIVGLFKRDKTKRGGYVVFGKRDSQVVDVQELGDQGFRINGFGGSAVAGVGDVNEDGLDDVAYYAGSPSTFVIFGRTTGGTIALSNIGKAGYEIRGHLGLHAGQGLGGIGDLNGDGLPEVLVGAPDSNKHGRKDSGSTYVVFGRRRPGLILLKDLGARGFRIDGARQSDYSGAYVGAVDDVNGDGLPEIVIGVAQTTDQPGRAYIVWGQP